MSHPILNTISTDLPPLGFLRSLGTVFATFDAQDSGNISYGVGIEGERYFVKTSGDPDNPNPYLAHPARIALLRNAARLSARFTHPILPPVLRVIESPTGPLIVYPWLDGELLGVPRAQRDEPASSFQRFRSLPVTTIERSLDAIFDLHAKIAEAGWVACDFYDGALIYDFASDCIWVMDLDTYSDAPFHNTMGQMFGSGRFMAPEEYELGALIDQQTTVFTMGRTALVFLSDGTLNPEAFRGSRDRYNAVARACNPDRAQRFDSMAAFRDAWRDAGS